MDTKNLNIVRLFFYFSSFIAFLIQITLFNNLDDFLSIIILYLSAIFTTRYCFNNNYFFLYPISLIMIFFSCLINLNGALYFKTLELAIITENLRMPLSTFTQLALFNLCIIISHKMYMNFKSAIIIRNKLIDFLEKFNFYNISDKKFLYFLAIIAVASKYLFFWKLNVPIGYQVEELQGGRSLLQDMLVGLNPLAILPVIFFFYKPLYNIKINNSKIIFFIYFLFIFIISMSRNSRSVFFDIILIIIIMTFLLFLFNKLKISKNFYFFLILFLMLTQPTLNFVENLSLKYLSERGGYKERTPIENIMSFGSNLFSNENLKTTRERDISRENELEFQESYYNRTIFNRLNIVLIHDNFNYLQKILSKNNVANIKELQINKFISILPSPIIKIFSQNFNKNDHINKTTASYLYGMSDAKYAGKFSVGSALMALYIVFDKWIYLLLLFLFMPVFIFFDSFYNDKTMIFCPFILIFFYTTGLGVVNFLSASDIADWFTLVVRQIPQTFLFVLVLNFFYKKIF